MTSDRERARVARLVNLYIKQLTEGCGDENCTRPTCFTYRKQQSDRPFRVLSGVSARATALALVELPSPRARLCEKLSTSEVLTKHAGPAHIAESSKKDWSSFSQNLYDSNAMRHFVSSSNINAKSSSKSHGAAAAVSRAGSTPLHKVPPSDKVKALSDPFLMLRLIRSKPSRHPRHATYKWPTEVVKDCDDHLWYVLRKTNYLDIDLQLQRLLESSSPGSVFAAIYRGLEGMLDNDGLLLPRREWRRSQPYRAGLYEPAAECAAANIATAIHALAAYRRMAIIRGRDEFEDVYQCKPALRLASLLGLIMSHFTECAPKSDPFHREALQMVFEHLDEIETVIFARDPETKLCNRAFKSSANLLLFWLMRAFQESWDGDFFLKAKSSALADLKAIHVLINRDARSAEMPFAVDPGRESAFLHRLGLVEQYFKDFATGWDPLELARAWEKTFLSEGDPITAFPWLFSAQEATSKTLLRNFRAVALSRMTKALHEAHAYCQTMERCLCWRRYPYDPTPPEILTLTGDGSSMTARYNHGIRRAMHKSLDIRVRRHALLDDALDQLWKREKRELLRPLKVDIAHAGEEGHDQGGVAQEFFRLVIATALDPSYGIFTVDDRTRLAWFNPACLEPLHKLEILGLIFGLALHNGFSLPVNLPLIFYRKLLLPQFKAETLSDIADFEDVHQGLKRLLEYDGDVETDIAVDYVFNFRTFGQVVDIDMTKEYPDSWSPAQAAREGVLADALERPAVTNENKEDYVSDYVWWLTDRSVRPQFEAFAKGLYSITGPEILRMLDAQTFKVLIEGHEDIDPEGLRRKTRYEGYDENDPVVEMFWEVFQEFSPQQRRQLLGFVTASERLPPNGFDGLDFYIQKHGDEDRIPGSMTCFGRLLLPPYSTKEMMKEKLQVAFDNGEGFGIP